MSLPFAATLSALGIKFADGMSADADSLLHLEIVRAPASIDAHFYEIGSPGADNMDPKPPLLQTVSDLVVAGAKARQGGDEAAAEQYFRNGLNLAVGNESRIENHRADPVQWEILRLGVRCALGCGDVAEARRLIVSAKTANPDSVHSEEWTQFRDVDLWSDEWLVAAVRCNPPDEVALDALVDRYWKTLFSRCLLLTLNHHKASDLAQDAWCRVLRARQSLRPGGNFSAYLTTIAGNLWRDICRSARRAGPLAEFRLESLDAPLPAGDEGRTTALSDILPDLNALEGEDKKRLMLDVDEALSRLSPLMRDILVARFLDGKSCSEIGLVYHRSEQTISSWVRQAVQEMKLQFSESGGLSDKNVS